MTDSPPDAVRTAVPRRSFLRRHLLLITAVTALVLAGALWYASAQQRRYTSTAQVLVEGVVVPNQTPRTPDMGTERAIGASTEVEQAVARSLGESINSVRKAASATVPTNTNLLAFHYTSTDRQLARIGANSLAAAYVDFRTSAPNTTPNGLTARVVSPADLPSKPSSPDVVIDAIAGIVVGLMLGLLLALLADRRTGRLRSVTRWQDVTGLPVLLRLPLPPVDSKLSGAVAGADAPAIQYLRNRVGLSLPSHGGVVLMVSVTERASRAVVSGLLAQAFAHTGTPAVLVRVQPGFSTGHERLDGAVGMRARIEHFGFNPDQFDQWGENEVHGTAAVRALLKRLRGSDAVVVVEAPPLTTSVDALDLADLADAALLVDDAATSRGQLARQAITDLRGTGCPVVGAVLWGVRRRDRSTRPVWTTQAGTVPVARSNGHRRVTAANGSTGAPERDAAHDSMPV